MEVSAQTLPCDVMVAEDDMIVSYVGC
jgi:hypothetical protein